VLSTINNFQNNADLVLLHDNALNNFRDKFYSNDEVHQSEINPKILLETFNVIFEQIKFGILSERLKSIYIVLDCLSTTVKNLDPIIKIFKEYYSYDTPEFLKKKHLEQYFYLYQEIDVKMSELFLIVEKCYQETKMNDYIDENLKNTARFAQWIAPAFLIYNISPMHNGGLGKFLFYDVDIKMPQEIYNQLNEVNIFSIFIFIISASFLAFLFSFPFFIYDYFANKSFKKSVESKVFPFPNKWEYIDWKNNYLKIKNTIELDIQDSKEQLEKNKIIYEKLKGRAGNSIFDFAERQASLLERLTIMQAELEYAKKLSENLTEQHEKTEAIRAKYAREMMDAQAMLAQQSDEALKEKLAMVNAMMGV
jgi:hypothetical protein